MTLTVYSKPACPQCDQAKSLLAARGVAFAEVTLDVGQPREEGKTYLPVAEFKARWPEVRAMPFVTEGDSPVGGLADLRRRLG
jgi:glutaredoxin 3